MNYSKLGIVIMSAMAIIAASLVINYSVTSEARINQLQREAKLLELEQQFEAMDKEVTLKRLGRQNVDDYILNLNKQISLLEAEINLKLIQHQLKDLSGSQKEVLTAQINDLKTKLDRFILDRKLMAYASADWKLIQSKPEVKMTLRALLKHISESTMPEPDLEGDVYIKAGQIIGGQGCTGVCTGTHLHYVVLKDRKVLQPCELLPYRDFIRWGDQWFCGVEQDQAILEWPMLNPWIISQKALVKSSVLGNTHLGLDLIDHDGAPVMASHDGWYYTVRRFCGGSLCNDKAAKIAFVCENKGCETGLVTEYWHLSWFTRSPSPMSSEIPISEFE